jgi:hypothetical protein
VVGFNLENADVIRPEEAAKFGLLDDLMQRDNLCRKPHIRILKTEILTEGVENDTILVKFEWLNRPPKRAQVD